MLNLMRRCARDFDQVLVSFVEEQQPPAPELLDICAEVVQVHRIGSHLRPVTSRPAMVEEFASAAFAASLELAVKKWRPAVVQLEFTHMAQYARHCRPARTILVEHDITMELHAQFARLERSNRETERERQRWEQFETEAWRSVDAVVAMSEADRQLVTGAPCAVIPNGVDLLRFQPGPVEPDRARILFVGSFAHLPNVLAIDFFLREVWDQLGPLHPRLHIIAGARHRYYLERYQDLVTLNLDRPDIEVDDFVADVRPAYHRASVVIAPLVASAGTNIKIMEAMAMGKAIVTTRAGIHGLDEIRPGRDVVVANTGAEMAAGILEVLSDPLRRRGLETEARNAAVEHYDWEKIAQRQVDLYYGMAGQQTPLSGGA
ncbi:MAG: glycosyltransferase [Candidatus Solibacter usitatus]|nr:glycosyltransferase [Candidatus Solibacter usitatus]